MLDAVQVGVSPRVGVADHDGAAAVNRSEGVGENDGEAAVVGTGVSARKVCVGPVVGAIGVGAMDGDRGVLAAAGTGDVDVALGARDAAAPDNSTNSGVGVADDVAETAATGTAVVVGPAPVTREIVEAV